MIKFFLNLSQSAKNYILFYLAKYRNEKKISQQKDLDKKVLAALNGKKLPNLKQLKRLPQTLNKHEKFILKGLILIALVTGVFLFYNGYYKNLISLPATGGEFSEGLIGSPLYINPIFAFNDADKDLSSLIYSGLIGYNEKLEPIPDLAERYEVSEDQKTYTFFLKRNIKWHDNKNFTANDVLFTISAIQNPNYKSPYSRSFTGVGVEQVDDYTVKFTLEQPYAGFLNILSIGILPKNIWENTPAANAKNVIYNQKPIGTGPYKFKSLVKDKSGQVKSYVLEKNKNYYAKIPYINKIIFKFYPDYDSATSALANKEVQNLSFLPKENLAKINKRDINIHSINLSQYTALFFNTKNSELLKDKIIREALALAIDKNKLLEDVLSNQGKKIDGPILANFPGYSEDIKKYEYNPQKALEILTADGWTIDNEKLKKKDVELKITLTTVEQNDNIKTANLIKEFWDSIGINVDLQIIAKDKIQSEIIMPRNYEVLLYGEIIGYDPDLFPFWHSSQRNDPGLNMSYYSNRKVDQLLEEARQTNDLSQRAAKYQEFQNLLIDDLPAVFLYSQNYLYPATKKIKGINVQRIASPSDRFINIENWYIKTKKQFFK
ncbi:MAG: ABC transporter substrate-binding protein [Candidatus Parcubacteria bacterium]|nr:ABC transporter substrate-binding protein [Candidatus Parcubacteria bacterium]